jgi:hypothetical protein
VFPIVIALVATTLAGCTDTGVPFGTGITGHDPTRPDAARGFCWRSLVPEARTEGEAYCIAQAAADEFVNGDPEPVNRPEEGH